MIYNQNASFTTSTNCIISYQNNLDVIFWIIAAVRRFIMQPKQPLLRQPYHTYNIKINAGFFPN